MSERDRREPEWSEHQARVVEAMQPARSGNPDHDESPWAVFLWNELQRVKAEQVVLMDTIWHARRMARAVQELDFTGHICFTVCPCLHCMAKESATKVLEHDPYARRTR